MEEGRSSFKILTGTPAVKRPLGRLRRRCEGNNRIYFKEVDINTRNWVVSAQDMNYWRALMNVTLHLRVSQAMELVVGSGKQSTTCGRYLMFLNC